MELAGRHDEPRSHSTIGVHTKYTELLAAIRPPLATRETLLTIDVRLDRATLARLDARHIRANGQNFDAQLMARNPRVAIERKFSQIAADIGAADADTMD